MTTALRLSLLILLLSPLLSSTSAAATPKHDLVRRSCVHASYPDVCLRTLSSYGGAASTPRDLAQVAVRVSLAQVRRASEFLSEVKSSGRREQGALNDCVEQMGDSVEELSKTLSALEHLRRGADFRWQMSNAETWVSAALSNEDTCLDGFKEIDGKVRSDVRRKITGVARVTSNALYFINLLDD
ncbi:Plant invertase/pectin methylesterase inhibitor superfamily protein [Perilla frutescens var. hirtella]|uniref:Plant invertase/pectin methylesterase inhibitor superfamily protein n=1 Tax=Perilla frutescens var. hirtella TaxID=608512 RepID=A0AAD4P7G3_PERFH|nr:Plant invertase/pectin methylesterase inhibitor superfamily protein [Perilla frutescens var. hirtella]KAH6818390.1 Plant invertase/pectin methylesterase inhibitor superfamily protein [Perilla frutescens var. frutescens]KAH6828567.1 Plant invertase/pectin methylesterase inhibitor superfamily protein [Perilla frutescens var. hirtella]